MMMDNSSSGDNNDKNGTGTGDSIDDLRQKGNHEFQQGNLDNAVAFYTAAIEKAAASAASAASATSAASTPSTSNSSPLIVNLCNRSACYYQMEDYENSKKDAELAWTTSNYQNVKSAYRLAKTLISLHNYNDAIQVLQTCVENSVSSSNSSTESSEKEIQGLRDLLQQAKTKQQKQKQQPDLSNETTIKGVDRPISIREFTKQQSLGVGNFSEIVVCEHKVTHEKFALKILEKKTAADLAKRQHPNVYNEIAMEARVLMARIPPTNEFVVVMYHSFQDYNNLYYLMDLHNVNPDLWSTMRYKGSMVGCHPSQIKRWMIQLISAIEHCHSHGIVHRDLKPENVLLNGHNHVVVIDFGTAKDLIQTDLNGPEFVGSKLIVFVFALCCDDRDMRDGEEEDLFCIELTKLLSSFDFREKPPTLCHQRLLQDFLACQENREVTGTPNLMMTVEARLRQPHRTCGHSVRWHTFYIQGRHHSGVQVHTYHSYGLNVVSYNGVCGGYPTTMIGISSHN
jgi:RIO-like serine/threonine protein kinase